MKFSKTQTKNEKEQLIDYIIRESDIPEDVIDEVYFKLLEHYEGGLSN